MTAARDEWRRLATDVGALLVLLGGVLFYALFYPTPYLHQVARDLPLVVVDGDRSALSRQLIRMADASDQLQVMAVLTERGEAERWLRDGRAHALLVVPREFERKALRGEAQTVGAYGNVAYFLVYSQAAEGLSQAIGSLNAGVVMQRLQLQGAPASSLMAQRDPLPLIPRPLFNPGNGYGNYVVPAVLVLILQQTMLIGIGLLGRAPIAARDAIVADIAGRSLVYVLLQTAYLLFFLGVVYGLYGFPRHGAWWTLLVFMLPFQFAVALLGRVLVNIFPTREFALQALLFTSMPAVFLSGFSWPREAMPAPLWWLSHCLPSTPAIDGFVRINQMGASLQQAGHAWALLWAQVLVFAAIVAWQESRRSAREGLSGGDSALSVLPDSLN
ncbi:ABC transporter permease [Lysobacter cavernae]|uniref:ABC transporter permease n=1 Tax=Lysobacter cavernae TaxID=1685901 RepID=A0ABV7RN59_9GAMM